MSCKWCGKYRSAHSTETCQYFQAALANGSLSAIKLQAKIQSGGRRVCGYCAHTEHASTKCPKRFNDERAKILRTRGAIEDAFKWLHEIGFGPGAMLSGMAAEYRWNSRGKNEKLVVIEEFKNWTMNQFMNELINGKERNWYQVNAVDTANERVQRIYLPYHITYAPKPTSKNVSIVHKANPEDIEKMKNHFDCYTSPVVLYDTAENFFAAGFKFKAGSGDVISPA